jgi:DNA-binding transcriptional regulator YiaG
MITIKKGPGKKLTRNKPRRAGRNPARQTSKLWREGQNLTADDSKQPVKLKKPGMMNKPVVYTSQPHKISMLHDSGDLDYATLPAITETAGNVAQETQLATKLVAKIEEESAEVHSLCETYQLKREELGRLTGFSLRALAEWAAGKLPSQPAKRRLQEIRRLLDALAQIVEPAAIPQWLHQRNRAFENLTPLQVIEVGEMDRLWAMVHDLASGQPD